MPTELSKQDIQNILSIMSRVDIKGNEAHAYITAEMKLRVMLKNMGPDTVVQDDSTAGDDTKED